MTNKPAPCPTRPTGLLPIPSEGAFVEHSDPDARLGASGAPPSSSQPSGQQLSAPAPAAVVAWMANRNPVFELLQCKILHVERGRVQLAMPMTETVMNTFGAMHGGMMFAFADLCFGFTANSAENEKGVSSSGEIHWLAPGKIGDRLIGEARQVWRRGRNGLYDVTLWNETQGDIVAIIHGRMRFVGGQVMPFGD